MAQTRSKNLVVLCALVVCIAAPARAATLKAAASKPAALEGPAHLVRDISTTRMVEDYNPSSFAVMNGIAYYAAQDKHSGYELWRTDGTPAGTWLVRDVMPGPSSSTPMRLAVVGTRLYFVADDGTSGRLLWMSDGTAAGTVRTRRAPAASVMSFGEPGYIAPGVDVLLTTYGERLDTTDAAGVTRPLANLCGGDVLFYPRRRDVVSALFGGHAYVLVTCLSSQRLWKTDGTSAGTQLVTEIAGVPEEQRWLELVAAGDKLYFNATDADHGTELWRSDGTAAGTDVVTDLGVGSAGSYPRWLTTFGSRVAFATGSSAFQAATSLWVSDGTAVGTSQLADDMQLARLTALDTRLLFVAEASGHASELWASDGSAVGTYALSAPYAVTAIARVGGLGYVWNGDNGLWVTDGTTAGTRLVRIFGPTPNCYHEWTPASPRALLESRPYLCGPELSPLGVGVLLRAGQLQVDQHTVRRGLWRSDGTAAGTWALTPGGSTEPSHPVRLAAHGDRVFFTRLDDLSDQPYLPHLTQQLWASDGSAGGTALVRDWPCRVDRSLPMCEGHVRVASITGLTSSGGRLLFTVQGDVAPDLWATDGTFSGTVQLSDTCASTPSEPCGVVSRQFLDPDSLVYAWNGRVFLAARAGGTGVELWTSDGTAAGTHVLADLCPGTCGSWLMNAHWFGEPFQADLGDGGPQFAELPGALFFTTTQPTPGLWRTDGTAAGTTLVAQVDVDELVVAGGVMYFIGGTFGSDYGLWRSDGTPAGTLRVAALPRASTWLTAAGSGVFLVALAPDGMGPQVLWHSDGTSAGTAPLAGLPGSLHNPDGLAAVGSTLFYSARTSSSGRELWRSDGTPAGTLQIVDLTPGPASSIEDGAVLVAAAGQLLFPAATSESGRELWSSDGTPGGTVLVQDIAPGPASSNPAELTVADGNVFFTADDGAAGIELWALPLAKARAASPRRTAEARSQQARLARNEAQAIANLRDIVAAAHAYRASDGAFPSNLNWMGDPVGQGYPAYTPPFLDPFLSAFVGPWNGPMSFALGGYQFTYAPGMSAGGAPDFGVGTFTVIAQPLSLVVGGGASGQRSFEADHTGAMCQYLPGSGGSVVLTNDGIALDAGCRKL